MPCHRWLHRGPTAPPLGNCGRHSRETHGTSSQAGCCHQLAHLMMRIRALVINKGDDHAHQGTMAASRAYVATRHALGVRERSSHCCPRRSTGQTHPAKQQCNVLYFTTCHVQRDTCRCVVAAQAGHAVQSNRCHVVCHMAHPRAYCGCTLRLARCALRRMSQWRCSIACSTLHATGLHVPEDSTLARSSTHGPSA